MIWMCGSCWRSLLTDKHGLSGKKGKSIHVGFRLILC